MSIANGEQSNLFDNIRDALKTAVSIFVDYDSPLASQVSRDIWSELSRTALRAGYEEMTARWESLRGAASPSELEILPAHLFVFGQDRPEAVEHVSACAEPESPGLYGLVVATPERPSPLSGSLLYQGVQQLTGAGIRTGNVLPALVPVSPKMECEAYTSRLFERLQKVRRPV